MPAPHSNLLLVFIYEAITTFILVLSTIFNVKTNKGATISGLTVGIVVLMSILCIGPITGGSLNPARSFGPSILDENFFFRGFWVYLTAPFVGAVLGGIYYENILKVTDKENQQSLVNDLNIKLKEADINQPLLVKD